MEWIGGGAVVIILAVLVGLHEIFKDPAIARAGVELTRKKFNQWLEGLKKDFYPMGNGQYVPTLEEFERFEAKIRPLNLDLDKYLTVKLYAGTIPYPEGINTDNLSNTARWRFMVNVLNSGRKDIFMINTSNETAVFQFITTSSYRVLKKDTLGKFTVQEGQYHPSATLYTIHVDEHANSASWNLTATFIQHDHFDMTGDDYLRGDGVGDTIKDFLPYELSKAFQEEFKARTPEKRTTEGVRHTTDGRRVVNPYGESEE